MTANQKPREPRFGGIRLEPTWSKLPKIPFSVGFCKCMAYKVTSRDSCCPQTEFLLRIYSSP